MDDVAIELDVVRLVRYGVDRVGVRSRGRVVVVGVLRVKLSGWCGRSR